MTRCHASACRLRKHASLCLEDMLPDSGKHGTNQITGNRALNSSGPSGPTARRLRTSPRHPLEVGRFGAADATVGHHRKPATPPAKNPGGRRLSRLPAGGACPPSPARCICPRERPKITNVDGAGCLFAMISGVRWAAWKRKNDWRLWRCWRRLVRWADVGREVGSSSPRRWTTRSRRRPSRRTRACWSPTRCCCWTSTG